MQRSNLVNTLSICAAPTVSTTGSLVGAKLGGCTCNDAEFSHHPIAQQYALLPLLPALSPGGEWFWDPSQQNDRSCRPNCKRRPGWLRTSTGVRSVSKDRTTRNCMDCGLPFETSSDPDFESFRCRPCVRIYARKHPPPVLVTPEELERLRKTMIDWRLRQIF